MRRKVDLTEYVVDDEYDSAVYYKRRNPVNQLMRNNRNKFVMKIMDTYFPVDIGEYIAYRIGNRTIGNFCDVELALYCCSFSLEKYVDAVISHYYYSDNDKKYFPINLLERYYDLIGRDKDILYRSFTNVDDCIEAARLHFIRSNRPVEEFQKFKESFIDMVMFDAKFGNYDRNLKNWMLYQDMTSGKIELYPLYDNEAILGFDLPSNKDTIMIPQVREVVEEAAKLPLYETTSEKPETKNTIYEVVRHIAKKYPDEAKKSHDKLKDFSERDLLEELDALPEKLSDERVKFTVERFLLYGALYERGFQRGLEELELEKKSLELKLEK